MKKMVNGKEVECSDADILQSKQDELKSITEQSNIKCIMNRLSEYGSVSSQLEFIVENGIEAFIARQLAIKDRYHKE